MPRGAEAKQRRKEAKLAEAEKILNLGGSSDFDPHDANAGRMPAATDDAAKPRKTTTRSKVKDLPVVEQTEEHLDNGNKDGDDEDSSDDDDDDAMPNLNVASRSRGRGSSRGGGDCCDNDGCGGKATSVSKQGGIKTMPLILLLVLTGTTVLPGLIFVADKVGGLTRNQKFLNNLSYRLGMGATPKKRIVAFYEKHDASKLPDVPHILSKYYGDYKTLTKRLERKYGDYGFFLGWQEDESARHFIWEQTQYLRETAVEQWKKYAPTWLKYRMQNVRYNLGQVGKRLAKIWKKTLWPALEPIFGVPDGVAEQKERDRREGAKRPGSAGGTKTRKKAEFRDDDEM